MRSGHANDRAAAPGILINRAGDKLPPVTVPGEGLSFGISPANYSDSDHPITQTRP